MSPSDGFAGARVLSLESRRGDDMRRLIAAHGGVPLVVPSVQEHARGPSAESRYFAERLQVGEIAAVIFLTGTGTRMLARAVEDMLAPPALAEALNRTLVIARGPKPLAALRQLGVIEARQVAPPHTWHEILQQIDDEQIPIRDRSVAVQEYGVPPDRLLDGLRQRGASVMRVPVYDWTLPDDVQPLRDAVFAAVAGQFDVWLVTSAVQVHHLFQIAEGLGVADRLGHACEQMCVASIGPTTTEALRDRGITPDLEASRSNMGMLVVEAAVRRKSLK